MMLYSVTSLSWSPTSLRSRQFPLLPLIPVDGALKAESEMEEKEGTQKEESAIGTTGIAQPDELVRINVGGEVFAVSLSTLRRSQPTRIGALFTGKYRLLRDASGAVFIDRSPRFFGAVLAWLRGEPFLPPPSLQEAALMQAEFRYYGLPFPRDVWLRYERSYACTMTLPHAAIFFTPDADGICYTFCGANHAFFLTKWDIHTGRCIGTVQVLCLFFSKPIRVLYTTRHHTH